MIIMIIFLTLTLILTVCTAYYLNCKKRNINRTLKQQILTEKDIKTNKKSKKKLSNILEVKIHNNIICLNNRYSVILKLGNIDYNMLSASEQDTIENILVQSALGIDYPIQFFSTTEYIDTSRVVMLLKQNKTQNHKIRDYQNHLIEYLQNLMENHSISVVTNYAIISYDGFYKNALDELARQSTSFKNNMLSARIVCEILNEDEIYNLIYRELNKNSVINISPLKEGGKSIYVDKKQKRKRN